MSLARISITIPPEVLEAADQRAEELDRSRSWLVVEALRTYLRSGHADESTRAGAVPERSSHPYAAARAGLGDYRRVQLQADLTLTPTERLLEAQRTLAVSEGGERDAGVDRVLTFDRYEDYLAWQRRDDLLRR